ncbi:MAG: winged helix-turn-helix transcriptional regulator, partial [Candidatus Heimdallarchaeota archaeon]|nr:winged helix-turn-helix transcriptional regulator [Candidatus Heimdallarchaeota archaeon]MCK5048425.1 winged helix-turn-helix transcriptional regulator [Candidatus Heimdallarchaeota archaeon]
MENQTDKLTKEQATFLNLIQNEVRFGIVLGLHFYQPMKLKQIAKFIERSDPTTLHHIKQMAKEDLIQLDTSEIVGKYYKLSDWGKKLVEEMQIGGSQDDDSTVIPEETTTKKDFEVQAKVMRTIGIVM